ncbi:MAG: response regulator [Sulfurimonas sp.]|nr:response regulator [Sulfurimonas sp.]
MAQNIIIIDDNPHNIKVASLVLSKEGYNVYSALSVKEGLHVMKTYKISLVLMDINMPKIDGFEGVKLIKMDEQLRYIPILMVTALSTKDDVIKALKAGADDYLVKPYNIKDLVTKTKHLTSISAFIEKWCTHHFELNQTINLDTILLD